MGLVVALITGPHLVMVHRLIMVRHPDHIPHRILTLLLTRILIRLLVAGV